MAEFRDVRLVSGQCEFGQVHKTGFLIVLQDLGRVRVHLQVVHEHLISSQEVECLQPLDKEDAFVFVINVEAFDAHSKVFGLTFWWTIVNDPEVCCGCVARLLYEGHRLWHLMCIVRWHLAR